MHELLSSVNVCLPFRPQTTWNVEHEELRSYDFSGKRVLHWGLGLGKVSRVPHQ